MTFHRRLRRQADGPVYMDRWTLLSTRRLTVYINRINTPDDDTRPHGHPWEKAWSLKLRGRYVEDVFVKEGDGSIFRMCRRIPERLSRIPAIHMIVYLCDSQPCWTLFVGLNRDRLWGFYEPDGSLEVVE